MLTVNLFDEAFSHLSCSVHGKTAKRIRYVRSRLKWDGITMLTDDMLCRSRALDHLESRVKVGWLLEPREYKPENYWTAAGLLPRLDLLLTHDQGLIDGFPDKVRFVPFGGCWIPESAWGLHPKMENVCQIMSAKRFLPGHRLRHEIARRFPQVECYGHGSASGSISYEQRASALAMYRFAIVVENSRAHNFFTEKLLDAMAVGCVPIYNGAPNLADWFDMAGIIPFDSIEELPDILTNLDYNKHIEGARHNLELFRPFEVTDDWISENILEKLL